MENKYALQNYNSMRQKQSIKKKGALNPMYAKQHSTETKQKISNSQKVRWNNIRQAIEQVSEKVSDEARQDLINQALYSDTISFRDEQQARNFFEIMQHSDKELFIQYLKSIVNRFIKEYLQHVQ